MCPARQKTAGILAVLQGFLTPQGTKRPVKAVCRENLDRLLVHLGLWPAADPHLQGRSLLKVEVGVPAKPAPLHRAEANPPPCKDRAPLLGPDAAAGAGLLQRPQRTGHKAPFSIHTKLHHQPPFPFLSRIKMLCSRKFREHRGPGPRFAPLFHPSPHLGIP